MSGVAQQGPVEEGTQHGQFQSQAPDQSSVNGVNMAPHKTRSQPTAQDDNKKKTRHKTTKNGATGVAAPPSTAGANGTSAQDEQAEASPRATNEENGIASTPQAGHTRSASNRSSKNGTRKGSSRSPVTPPTLPPISPASKARDAESTKQRSKPSARASSPQVDQRLPPITPPKSQEAQRAKQASHPPRKVGASAQRSRPQSQAQAQAPAQRQAQQASRKQSAEDSSRRRAAQNSAGGSASPKASGKQQPRGSGKARQPPPQQQQQQQQQQQGRRSKADASKPTAYQLPTRLQKNDRAKGPDARREQRQQQPRQERQQRQPPEERHTRGRRSSDGHVPAAAEAPDHSGAKTPDARSRSASPSPVSSTGKTSPSSASEFRSICETLEELFEEAKTINEGMQADYIPELAAVNPDLFAVAAVSCDGETWVHGDYKVPFTMQSTCKPLLYCLAQSLVGWEEVHEHVGYEPSGQRFNAFALDEDKNPHNPMINAGAIMSSAIIWSRYRQKVEAYKAIKEFVEDMAGHVSPVTFDNSVYLSELGTASRNFALTHFMSETSSLLADADINQVLELYFSACSLSCDCLALATIAATLANGGVCPITQHEAMTPEMVQNVLSLMYNCGMYDYSGRFAFEVGIPAKSGVSGSLFLSLPGKLGIAIWSPRLDRKGNTVRGLHVSQRLVQEHPNLHVFGNVLGAKQRIKMRLKRAKGRNLPLMLIHCAADGNLDVVKRVLDEGGVDVNACDQDGRTALHEAIVRGHEDVAKFLVSRGADCLHKDRFGNTPCSDAVHYCLEHVIPAAILEEHVHRPPTAQSRPSTAETDSPFFQRRDRSPAGRALDSS